MSLLLTILTYTITVTNPSSQPRTDVPVVIGIDEGPETALVMSQNTEIPCQLDDMDGNGFYDELCFLTDLRARETRTFNVTLNDEGSPRQYTPRVYAELLLRNPKVKDKNKHDHFLTGISVHGSTDSYQFLHHHGPAFESELVAYRLYFDKRQTVDLYGKHHKQLELQQTQFYPDEQQKQTGFGDDVLYAGPSLSCGTLRGWDGKAPVMAEAVTNRTERFLAYGPLRTVLEVVDTHWKMTPTSRPVTMTTRYILYAGHRDVEVQAQFSRPVPDLQFSTGLMNKLGSTEFTDHQGLRGTWGSDWTVRNADTLTLPKETIGMGISIPRHHIVSEEQPTPDNYAFVLATATDRLTYHFTFCSANETFGYTTDTAWYAYLRQWADELRKPVIIHTQKQ